MYVEAIVCGITESSSRQTHLSLVYSWRIFITATTDFCQKKPVTAKPVPAVMSMNTGVATLIGRDWGVTARFRVCETRPCFRRNSSSSSIEPPLRSRDVNIYHVCVCVCVCVCVWTRASQRWREEERERVSVRERETTGRRLRESQSQCYQQTKRESARAR